MNSIQAECYNIWWTLDLLEAEVKETGGIMGYLQELLYCFIVFLDRVGHWRLKTFHVIEKYQSYPNILLFSYFKTLDDHTLILLFAFESYIFS